MTSESPAEPESAASDTPPVRTLAFTVAYDGSRYCGWQVQPNGVGLQHVFEEAFAEFAGERVHAEASGRTDAGVHALAQVVSVETRSRIPCHGFRIGLQRHLPGDIVVHNVVEQPLGFSARFDAVRKTYRYVIQNEPVRSPFLRPYALWQRGPLDEGAMHDAVQALVGTHDFRSFETDFPNRLSSVRTVYSARVWREARWPLWDSPGAVTAIDDPLALRHAGLSQRPFVVLEITANGFLYNMVRAIVGTLIHVGRGRWTRADVERILASGSRAEAGETAPPQGLYLVHVEYDISPERIADRRRRMAGGAAPELDTAE